VRSNAAAGVAIAASSTNVKTDERLQLMRVSLRAEPSYGTQPPTAGSIVSMRLYEYLQL